jgi:hypothetical protein
VEGGTYDLKDWFRQLAVCSTERWKGRYRSGGGWVDDRRLQMGGVAAATIAHRLGMLLAALLLEDLDRALAALLLEEPGRFPGLAEWREERRAACGGEVGCDRPYDLRNFQDDFTFQVESDLSAWADGVIRASLAGWEVELSGKEKPLAVCFESIGGEFTYRPEEGRSSVLPRPDTLRRLREVEGKLWGLVAKEGQPSGEEEPTPAEEPAQAEEPEPKRARSEGRVYHRVVEAAVGLLEWCGRFVDGGGRRCFEPQRFLRWLRGRNQGRARAVPRAVCDAFTQVREDLEAGRGRPFIADAVWGHPGDAVAGDASTSVGWGIVVGWFVFFGLWEATTIAAFEAAAGRVEAAGGGSGGPEEGGGGALGDEGDEVADRVVEHGGGAAELVSISPAELLVTGYTVHAMRDLAGAGKLGLPVNGCFYSRCDNDSAVRVVNAGRARSPAMTEALRVVHEEEIGAVGERRLRMRLEHIRTHENKVADLLSRGDIKEAIAMVTARWSKCEVRTMDEEFLRSTEKRVREATLHEYDGWD